MRGSERVEFEWVFRSTYPSVLRTTFLVLHDRGRAEEVTQDAFLRLYERWRGVAASSTRRPVVLDGHRGLAIEVMVPPDADLTRCTDEEYTLWRTEPVGDSVHAVPTPGVVNRLWILDVDGTRLVVVANLHPDETDELHQEQTAIAETIRFDPVM